MKIFKLRCSDGLNVTKVRNLLLKMGCRGQMNLSDVLDKIQDYCYHEMKQKGKPGTKIRLDKKRAKELADTFGSEFGVKYVEMPDREPLFFTPGREDLKSLFMALEILTHNKISASFTYGLDVVQIR